MRINNDTGCVYDTLMFLSRWIMEIVEDLTKNDMSVYYNDIKQSISKNTQPPRYLYPFLCTRGESESFLFNLLFNREYSKCNFETLQRMLNNKSFMKKNFIAYYIPKTSEQALYNVITMDNPDNAIDVLARRSTDRNTDTYLFYILVNFDKVLQTLHDIVFSVYAQIDTLRKFILPDLCAESLKKENIFGKLKAITNANGIEESAFTVSLSLIKTDVFSYRKDERDFILLGYDFEKRLETEYKYCDVSFYSFAQAIASNPMKYDIFTSLINNSSLTAADLNVRLNAGRSALDNNIREMEKSKIIISEPVNKRTNRYSINNEYLILILYQLKTIINGNGISE